MSIPTDRQALDYLAKAIARAMVTAHDEAADEMSADWPEEVRRAIPSRDQASGAERLAKARELEPEGKAALAEAQRQDRIREQTLQQVREERAREEAGLLEGERARFLADQAAHVSLMHAHTTKGAPVPPPVMPERTVEELRLSRMPRGL